MNKNIKIAKELIRLAKSLVAVEMNKMNAIVVNGGNSLNICRAHQNINGMDDEYACDDKKHAGFMARKKIASVEPELLKQKTARNAASWIANRLRPYGRYYDNSRKDWKTLNDAKEDLFNLGIDIVSKHENNDRNDKGWHDEYHVSFANEHGEVFTIAVVFNVMLAGSVNDHELSYDFTVSAYDENKETQNKPRCISDEKLSKMNHRQACDYIYGLVEGLTHDVYDNRNHDWKALCKARQIIDGFGMDEYDSRIEHRDEKGYSEVTEYHYLDENLNEVVINVRITVFYAGSMKDLKDRYDFTVQVF